MIGFTHPTVSTEVNLLNRSHYVRLPVYEWIDRTTGEVLTLGKTSMGYIALREPVCDVMYTDYPRYMLWDVQEFRGGPEHPVWLRPTTAPVRFLGFASIKMSREWMEYV